MDGNNRIGNGDPPSNQSGAVTGLNANTATSDAGANEPKPPGSECLKWMARCIGSGETRVLAGIGLASGLFALSLLGPALIPVLIVAVSVAVYVGSTAIALANAEPSDSKLKILLVSLAEFMPIPAALLTIAFFIPIYLIYHCCCAGSPPDSSEADHIRGISALKPKVQRLLTQVKNRQN